MRKKLNEAEKFWIAQHAGKIDAPEMAKRLHVPLALVEQALASLPEPAKPKKQAKAKKIANFDTGKGIVAMTGDQAMDDDAAEGQSPFLPSKATPRNDKFFKEHRKNIHKIHKDKPFG